MASKKRSRAGNRQAFGHQYFTLKAYVLREYEQAVGKKRTSKRKERASNYRDYLITTP